MIPGLVFLISLVVTRWVRETAKSRSLLDRPNERSSHVTPTPRLGGIGIMVAFLPASIFVAVTAQASAAVFAALACMMMISVLGLLDDVRQLPAYRRLVVQFLGAALVVGTSWASLPAAWSLFGVWVPQWLLGLLSLLWIVWMTNLYNFMDGIDGLAGGQAVLAGAALALVAFNGGSPIAASLALLLVAGSLGFLAFNFPPATIFMGDVGSTAIGFFLSSLPFIAGEGIISIEATGLATAIFLLDATYTLFRRIRRGEKLSQAHRSHLYQRPLALGVSHRSITLVCYCAMALFGAGAVLFGHLGVPGRVLLLAAAVVLFSLLATLVACLERGAERLTRKE